MTNNTTFYNFNRSNKSLQVAMNFNVETMIPEDGEVSLVCTIVDWKKKMPTYVKQEKNS